MSRARKGGAVQGAHVELEALLDARFAAREFDLGHRRNAMAQLTGPEKSSFRGRGLDFEEVRAYQAGDDIRQIDWRVTARSGRAHTKVFREERERPMLVAVDQRQPMFFGSRHCFKSVLACQAGALLAWGGLARGDRVGGIVIGNEGERELRPARSRRAVLALLRELHASNQGLYADGGLELDVEASFCRALRELRRVVRPGSSVFLVSDFAGSEHPEVRENLFHLARRAEVTALFCYDPLEAQLPPPGRYVVSDGRRQRTIDTSGRALRRAWQARFDTRMETLHRELGQAGIPLLELRTDDDPVDVLGRYYSRRNPQSAPHQHARVR